MVKVAQARSKAGKFVPDRIASAKPLKRRMFGRTFALMGTLVATAAGLVAFMASNATSAPGARTISFYTPNTKQNLTVTYKRYGQYIPSAMRKINYMLRDWRTDQVVRMDPKLIDLLWEMHRGLGSRKPISVLSGYRSMKTNTMLRRRSRAVSRYSRHMFGMATDVRFPDISLEKLRNFAMLRQRGGVGYYRGSFVHVDVGAVRHWPRMSKRQLAKLFPSGNSLHIPRGVARRTALKAAPRPMPHSKVVASAPAGVVRGRPPARIKVPARVQIASIRPKRKKARPAAIRLARNVPIPRAKPAPARAVVTASIRKAVPLPRVKPATPVLVAALEVPEVPKASEIVVAAASTAPSRPVIAPRREVVIARPVRNSVEVITARPVQSAKSKRGLFGLASLAPRRKFNDDAITIRTASANKANRRPLASRDLMKVNRSLKGDRLLSQTAMRKTGSRIRLAGRIGAPEITRSTKRDPFRKENPPENPRPFGLLSALFPMFSDGRQPLRRR